jgi:hypothetical protein
MALIGVIAGVLVAYDAAEGNWDAAPNAGDCDDSGGVDVFICAPDIAVDDRDGTIAVL